MKKYIKILFIVSIFVSVLAFSCVLASEVDVQINGEIIDFTDSNGNKVNAQIINDRTMVPLRKIFEVLGCEIDWNGDTRTVTAKREQNIIILQIDNKEAIKNQNGVEEKIKLDVAPTIVNDRTLVPLRFIAESLNKHVGWDASNRTAIIIDYNYFVDIIKQKNMNLHNILTSNNISNFSVTREYTDLSDSSNNNTAKINGNITRELDYSIVTLMFEGNNDLIQDIINEGWSNITYETKYNGNSMFIKTQNTTLERMLKLNNNIYNKFDTKTLDLTGSFEDDLSNAIQNIFDINENKLTVNTFNSIKKDFDKFVDLFVINGTRTLNYNNAKLDKFDYTKFYDIVYGNDISTNLSFINKTIFNYDFVLDDVFYDWSKIDYNMDCQNNNLILKINMENEYNEKVIYTFTAKSN